MTWQRTIRRARQVGATQLQLELMDIVAATSAAACNSRHHAKSTDPKTWSFMQFPGCTTVVREIFRAAALTFAEVQHGGKGRYLCWLGLGLARAAVEQMQDSLLDALGLVKGTQRLYPGKQHIWHACRVLPSMCLWHKLLALAIHCLYTGITISA